MSAAEFRVQKCQRTGDTLFSSTFYTFPRSSLAKTRRGKKARNRCELYEVHCTLRTPRDGNVRISYRKTLIRSAVVKKRTFFTRAKLQVSIIRWTYTLITVVFLQISPFAH